MTNDNQQRMKDFWQQKSDEELINASERLSAFSQELEEIVRAELRRRRMPEPEPIVRPEPMVRTVRVGGNGVDVVRAKLRPPAVAMMVSAGISLAVCLFSLLSLEDVPIYYESERLILRAVQTLNILSLPALAFSIYGALQMMNVRKHRFAITSAIITILSGFLACIGFPIGIWALIVLLKPQTKSAFTGNSVA